jgi:hypothetical protein
MDTTTGIACSACGGGVPSSEPNSKLLDNGWVLPYDTFGYYGGFTDNVSVLLGHTESRHWNLCHDCVLSFLNLFPRLARSINSGQHPCDDEKPCCRFAWRLKENGECCQHPQFGEWIDSPNNN